jgi:hypothetical protein
VALLLEGCGGPAPDAVAGTAPPPSAAPSPPSRTTRPDLSVSPVYQGALKANIDDAFAAIVLADGRKTVVPVESLAPGDLAFLARLAHEHPLVASGKSSVVVVASTGAATGPKKTIEVAKADGPLETVQLCSPNAGRDQIGATCMLYARVHWLDIAGFYTDLPEIFAIINGIPTDHPWTSPKYREGLSTIVTGRKTRPVVHEMPPGADAFEWARAELRQGRPLLAALPREVEMALPAEFLAARPWSGGDIGHQIVVNGFTWNRETGQGSFHIVNSWAELMEFDLDLKYAGDGALIFEASLSPVGEPPKKEAAAAPAEIVEKVALIRPVGSVSLFEVTTNRGTRRVLAADAAAARRMVEGGK